MSAVFLSFSVSAGSSYRVRPESSAVLQGGDARLDCAYSSLGSGDTVIWQGPPGDKVISHGRTVMKSFPRHSVTGDPAAGEFNLEIRQARPEDGGKYSCYTDPATAAEDATLTVIVPMPGPPTITGGELVSTAGGPLSLTCRASGGHPAPRLTWLNGTHPFRDAAGSHGNERTLELFVPRLTRWDHGANFTCLADQGFPDLARTRATSRILRVKYPPVVSVPSPSVHVREGEPASLSCMVDSNPRATVTWRRVGGSLPVLAVPRDHLLHLPKVSSQDGGLYHCVADNKVPPAGQGTVTLQVYYPPVIESTLEDEVTMLFGQDDLSIECFAAGNPTPHVRWRRKDTSLYWDNPLRFHRVRYDVQGTYQCVAASDGFQEVTKDVFVDVVGRPSIKAGLATLTVAAGSNARLYCEILGDPLPVTVTWIWQTKEGTESVVMATDVGVVITEELTGVGIASSLVVEDVGISEEGTYICQTSNMFGDARREIRLEVTDSTDSIVVISVSMATLVLGIVGAIVVCVAVKKQWLCREQRPDTSTLSSSRSMPPVPKPGKRLGHGTNDSGVEDLELQELDGTIKPRPPPRAGKEWTSVGLSYTGLAHAHSNALPPYSTVERHKPDGVDIRSRGEDIRSGEGIPEQAILDDVIMEDRDYMSDDPPAPPPKDKKGRWTRRAPSGDMAVPSSLHETENALNEIQADSI
ncbi:PREDICTED: hemicentin-2-like [Branchiostoma belcheri]|uniref:Hemicentin-2-like n=1 Tax=Branchiostoma belcheri TaxID=7741 RepID=A0A6P4ZA67_BRABE|nr:PREDICTED: hemicentin-2-like [Branchiostoma belcheri]